MRAVLLRFMSFLYQRLKSSAYLSGLYYSVANTQYFSNLQVQEGMLADKTRVDIYHHAIAKHVRPGDVLIDLGTGTGILSFMALSNKPARIYALEHGPVIEVAKAAAKDNGYTGINFVKANSKNFKINEKVDVILHEQMGAFLFDERMIENVIDLRDRLLKRDGKILPSKFGWFIEPVKLRDEKSIPFAWEHDLHGVSFRALRHLTENAGEQYRYRRLTGEMVDYLLADPSPVWVTDLQTVKIADQPHRLEFTRTVNRAGRLDGFCIYFSAAFDDELSFTTEPLKGTTQSWSIPMFRVEARQVNVGDTINVAIEMADIADPASYIWTWSAAIRSRELV
jgi:protein arginine N-methyltransferase 1